MGDRRPRGEAPNEAEGSRARGRSSSPDNSRVLLAKVGGRNIKKNDAPRIVGAAAYPSNKQIKKQVKRIDNRVLSLEDRVNALETVAGYTPALCDDDSDRTSFDIRGAEETQGSNPSPIPQQGHESQDTYLSGE